MVKWKEKHTKKQNKKTVIQFKSCYSPRIEMFYVAEFQGVCLFVDGELSSSIQAKCYRKQKCS